MKQITQLLLVLFAAAAAIQYIVQNTRSGHGHTHGPGGHKHDGAVLSIDYYAYASRLRSWNPHLKAAFSMGILLLCLMLDNIYVSLLVVLAMGYLTVVRGGMPFWTYLSLLSIPLFFLFFGSLAIAVGVSFSPMGEYRVKLFSLYLYCSRQSILSMLQLMLKAFGAVSAMYMLTFSTPAGDMIRVLRSLRIPKLIIELMNMIYRYIFLLMDTQCRMKNAAVARLGYCDFRTSLVSFGRVAANLLVVSLRKGNQYYQALEARCYDGELLFLSEKVPVKISRVAGCILFLGLMLLTRYVTR